jgi:hypothetical protein
MNYYLQEAIMKKLIIVCEEKLRQYGDFLAQLISLQDDKDEEIVGVKDGTVAAQVWTEKEYGANAPQISSEQYILFIGNSKLMKEKRTYMQEQFSQYGMCYGWLGKQAAVFVDHAVTLAEYDDFMALAQENQPEVTKLVEAKSEVKVNNVLDKYTPKMAILVAMMYPLVAAVGQGVKHTVKAANNKKIEAQQYSCLTLIFYLRGLAPFLGLNE